MKTCLVCDFGGSYVKYALVDEQGNMSENGRLPAPVQSVQAFADCVHSLYARFQTQIGGIALSMPGYIDPQAGILAGAGAYLHLYGQNLIHLTREKCPVPVTVENDGKCAALAESWQGALKDVKDGAVIVLGTGLGGGIIKDRKIHGGRGFVAGEISYLSTDLDDLSELSNAFMSCGMMGITYRMCKKKNIDLAAQNSGEFLQKLDRRLGIPYRFPDAPLKKEKMDGIQFFSLLSQGDSDAEDVYRQFIKALAWVVHSIQVIYAPEKIAVGGGLSRQECVLRDLKQRLNALYHGMRLGDELKADIVPSVYFDECNLLGAMRHHLQQTGG
ncbi:MAG TPA: ROK family protein [Clostridiales bacterium]|jgi:predicted NBD/HSP70 family sugar kinase|nr:ROK family protein [Clostridiales bacterium]